MFGNLGNLGNLMRQMQDAKKRAEDLKDERVEASSGGLVTVVVNGVGELISVRLDATRLGLDAAANETLQDAVTAAMQEAQAAAQAKGQALLGELTGGLNIPGLGL
ncbi:MAG: YbaB/EbfC family nucleoid-associated protein [Fimbriimonadaceae bacterium]|nr:YbaB/EbfC family nucleoid-associated protein [Fimbriimonadaceae bacterium]